MIISNTDYEHNLLHVDRTMPGSDRAWQPMALLKWTNKEEYLVSSGCSACGNVGAPSIGWRYLVTQDVIGNTFPAMFCTNTYVHERIVTEAEIADLKSAPDDYYGKHPNNRSMWHRENAIKRAFTTILRWSDNDDLPTYGEALKDGKVLNSSNPVSPVPPNDTIKRIYGNDR